MRLCVELKSSSTIRLPTDYNHSIQGMIYNLLDKDQREFLHKEGYLYGKRSMKLFTFSRLFGFFKKDNSMFFFNSPVRLWIGSPLERFMTEVANALLKKGKIILRDNELKVESISIPKKPKIDNSVICRTLSPVTIYSTLMTANGQKKTYYYSPYENEFSELASKNLLKKAALISGHETIGSINIQPLKRCKEVICIFKGTVVKAWDGLFKVNGDPSLLEVMYEAGLGSKNSSGFGMIEVENVA